MGYKWYDHMGLDVAYPFGHGLSYTSFHLDAVRLSKAEGPVVYASCDITNTGDCDGDALIQVYVGKADSQVFRPVRSLAGFRKLHLLKGQKRTVLVKLDPRAFQYWDFKTASYEVEEGEYQVSVGFSSRDLVEEKSLYLNGTVCKPSAAPAVPRGRKPVFEDLFQGPLPLPTPKEGLTLNSTVDEILATEAGAEVLGPIGKAREEAMASLDPEEAAMMKAALHDQPLRSLAMGGVFSAISVLDQIHQLEAK